MLIKRRGDDKIWKGKSCKQARQLYRLFARLLFENQIYDVEGIHQKQVADLEDLFRSVAKSYGKSPADHQRSIAELRAIGASKPKEERGLEPGTKNRHFSFLGDLLDFLKSQGEPIDRHIDLSDLRSPQKKRPRNARSTLQEEEIKNIFELPCFTGCAGWEKEHVFQPGPLMFHRALFFVTMLLHYEGARREEICGLKADEIKLVPIRTKAGVQDWPCMIIDENNERGVKNVFSVRVLPLHPELIRLGFMDYVARIRELEYDLLFPDLKSPTSMSPMGDRFYDEFIVGLEIAVPNARQQKKVIHSIRKSFGNFLKQRGVVAEFRADLLGHKGETTTEEIYCDPVALGKMLGLILRLPNVTEHLSPVPIRLLPWVETKDIPPFSRGTRLPFSNATSAADQPADKKPGRN